MHDCPICGAKEGTIDHVLTEHMVYEQPKRIRCWCRYRFRVGSETQKARIVDHFESHGGVLCHYLACKLGVDGHDQRMSCLRQGVR